MAHISYGVRSDFCTCSTRHRHASGSKATSRRSARRERSQADAATTGARTSRVVSGWSIHPSPASALVGGASASTASRWTCFTRSTDRRGFAERSRCLRCFLRFLHRPLSLDAVQRTSETYHSLQVRSRLLPTPRGRRPGFPSSIDRRNSGSHRRASVHLAVRPRRRPKFRPRIARPAAARGCRGRAHRAAPARDPLRARGRGAERPRRRQGRTGFRYLERSRRGIQATATLACRGGWR